MEVARLFHSLVGRLATLEERETIYTHLVLLLIVLLVVVLHVDFNRIDHTTQHNQHKATIIIRRDKREGRGIDTHLCRHGTGEVLEDRAIMY